MLFYIFLLCFVPTCSSFNLFDLNLFEFIFLQEGGNNVDKTTVYAEEKYVVSCGWLFGWGRCSKYRSVQSSYLQCKDGYKQRIPTDSGCDLAICDGKTNDDGACSIYYSGDRILTKTGQELRHSGGKCNAAATCSGCNDGFYADGPYCRICSKISHCNHRRCSSSTSQICVWCEGEIKPSQYYRAYTNHLDNTKCQKACSWRGDSTRCYPGTCANELASNCVCSANFGGTHCENILNTPAIDYNHCKFSDNGGFNVLENDPNHNTDGHEIIWTNFVGYTRIETKMVAKYLQPADTRSGTHYVRDFRVGVVEEKVTLSYKRGGVEIDQKVKSCVGMDKNQPVDSKECPHTFNAWNGYQHDDQIIFQVSSTNGGFVKVADRDRSGTDGHINTHYYNGKTLTREFEFHWDLVPPYHCSETSGASCTPFATLSNGDLTENPTITFTWGEWADDLSGLKSFSYDVFDLGVSATTLIDGAGGGGEKIETQSDIPPTTSTATFTLTEPGMYSIHMVAHDKAGNFKVGRTLFLFDDQSVVDKQNDDPICSTASKDTQRTWVVEDTNVVTHEWPDRYINARHKSQRWLNQVATYAPVGTSIYEDLYGKRTNVAIKNVHAIVDFKVSYEIRSNPAFLKDSQPLTSVNDIYDQQEVLTVDWADGDRMQTKIVAIDVMGKTNEDSVTVYRDATYPIIKNLWLTIGDRLNVSVHRVEDFTQMTIEWEAYDIHSGLDSVNWRLYDHLTNEEHGYEDIIAQGHATDISDCKTKYNAYARGPNCYCTPFMGCYHRHFQIIPEIKAHGGLKAGHDRGTHEYDYFIEVTVTNKANLTTVLKRKITVDVSPPHSGVVHDGLPSGPEVDYQQGMDLKAYWDQFFDKESGVFFYQYIVGTSCAVAADFNLDLAANAKIVETYNTDGTHTATADGTYYFTVVAYNRALDPSSPVCSDGVTIDSSVPGVKEVVIDGALITGGLIKDASNTNFYILSKDRTRRKIAHVTSDCVSKATVVNNLELFPLTRTLSGAVEEVDGRVFCSNSSAAPNSIGLSLSKSSMMEMSWMPIDIPAKVYDYEVGFSSTAGSSAPDIMAFESTKQHAHHRVMHGNVPDGSQFYIIIKTISKSNVEGLSTIGPCFMDTTPPEFDSSSGGINVAKSGDYLITSWNAAAVSDSEEFFEMEYQFAIGHKALGSDVQNYEDILGGGTCTLSYPPSCTAVKIVDLDWYLHGYHTYYVTLKVTNTAGLTLLETSAPYVHNVQLPAQGVVIDIDTAAFSSDIPLQDIEDFDFQTDTTSMSARWSGFLHPHLNVTYKISIGTTAGGNEVTGPTDVGDTLSHQETGLTLTPYQKYYFSVTAVSTAGNVVVSSDGVTIVTANDALMGVMIYDGKPCTNTALNLDYHVEDYRFHCDDDIDVQLSTKSLKAYWTVPEAIQSYTTDAYIAVEQRSGVGNMWSTLQDYIHLSTVFDVSLDDLTLTPGIKYRISLKLCAKRICFAPFKTDGVMVIHNPPITGALVVEHLGMAQTGSSEKLKVSFAQFYDPDIEDTAEKYDAVDVYEMAITDNSILGKTYMTWTKLSGYSINGNTITFEYILNGTMDFSRCKRISIRGYNQVGQYSIISKEIKQCDAFNPKLIIPNIVIDAVGTPDEIDSSKGYGIFLEENAYWLEPDKDYTPYKNLISATWPTLRQKDYTYAILNARTIDVTTYYRQVTELNLKDPCSHPDSIRCGHTINGYINEEFTNNELVHGNRYTVCVFAPYMLIPKENHVAEYKEVRACSDGIIIDLTSPKSGRLWIGNDMDFRYQTSSTDLLVSWDGFHDIEEYGLGPHGSGVQNYILGIGTTAGGNDVYSFEDMGVVQHIALHNLNLQNGYQYYATLKAIDFANRETVAISEPVTIDFTPPDRSSSPITLENRHITSRTEINPCWKGVFTDLESGVAYYLWSVGSEPGYTDMMGYMKVVDNECGITDENNPLDLQEGHYYYINVRAFNNAGLSSLATSWAFVVDTTPPTAGHVYDGDRSQLTGDVKDIDFQTETKVIHSYWEGFHDSHSNIKEYYVSVGTCPQCGDVLPQQAVGVVNEFTLENLHLGTGLRYFTSVTACNTADQCTTVTSDGVVIDNSPPTAGAVQDGVGFFDTEYQSMTTYISAKWTAFDDPQSGLEKYIWRVGSKPGYDDIIAPIELHVTLVASLLNSTHKVVDLPINKRIFVTVRAYNKAGLWSEASSNGFLVDNTAPVITRVPTFSADFGVKGLTQIYKTSMKVEWAADDGESFIKRQYLSIKSHIGGEFSLSSQAVNGIARTYVFTGLDLHDGVTYYVTLITCNSADICTQSTSQGMLVDSSPPSRGTFAINTDHASDPELSRHEKDWMSWGTTGLYLAWLGFSDIHSGINHYIVTVGSSYMAKDLTKDHEEKYIHVDTNTDHGDEGKVQLYKIETEILTSHPTFFVTVWAVNGVGLRSEMIHSAFVKAPPTSLVLVRRCDAISCEGHCVCAPQDQKCPYKASLGSCNDVTSSLSSSTQYAILLVKDSNGYSTEDQAVTSTNNVLRGMWLISQQYPSKPKWYEWSVGLRGYDEPQGLFDPVHEKVWYDAAQLMDAVYTVPRGKSLLENTLTYTFFVRVWYDYNTFATFKSDGIILMTQGPLLATIRGTAVTEKVQGTKVKDSDYLKVGRPITYTWTNKFLEAEATIEKYRLYLSTFPGGYDILTVQDEIPGTIFQFNMSRINLVPGVTYYSNIIAYNYAGAHTTSSSDGFIVDYVDPFAGIVYDGLGRLDQEYKNSSDIVEAHWHGFVDTESGIQSYHWCVGETTFVHTTDYDNSECSILPWTNVGLHVSVSRNLSSEITPGKKIYNKVYAVDNVGLTSDISVSDGTVVDRTPPVPEKFFPNETNIAENPSFDVSGGDEIMLENASTTDICMISSSYHPTSWIPTDFTCMGIVSSDINLARDGRSFLFIRGSVHQQLIEVKAGKLYKISFYSSHLPITDSTGANKEGFLNFDGHKIVFLIYTKPYRHDGHVEGVNREIVSWHYHVYYLKADTDKANITLGSMDMTTGIFIDNLVVYEVNLTTGHSSGQVTGHVVYLHEWSSVHGSWSFMDPESPITDYTWAVGYTAGGTQIASFKSAGTMNFDLNNNVTLVHNTYIYITTIATNAAELRGITYSDPILVDLTPPDIKFVNDGLGNDEEAWEFNEVVANWDMEDLESGILRCQWAIGYRPGSNELQAYTTVTAKSGFREFPYDVLVGRTIYSTLRCENNGGLFSTLSSNGLKVSDQPPLTDTAQINIIPLSGTAYTPGRGYQGITDDIRMKWTGFTDDIGIERYSVLYNPADGVEELMFFPDVQDVLYTHFTKVSLTPGTSQNFSIRAVNKLFKRSDRVGYELRINTEEPTIDGKKSVSINWVNQQIIVSWDGIFDPSNTLYYEVSAGSYKSGVQIIQWQETNQTSITFGIPASVSSASGAPVFLTISGVSHGGYSKVVDGTFTIP